MSSKKLNNLQAGALDAWTPAQQAALYHQHLVRQAEADDKAKLKEYEESKAKEGKEADVKPHAIEAGKLIDDLVRQCPPRRSR
jgi:hypothetical protein